MRQDLYRSIRFWVDKGVEGFRLDVIDQIGKVADEKITGNGPRLHEFLRELSAEVQFLRKYRPEYFLKKVKIVVDKWERVC